MQKNYADKLVAKDAEIAEQLSIAESQTEQIRKNFADQLIAKDIEVADKLSASKNQIEDMQKSHADELVAKDAEVAQKLAEAAREVARVEKEGADAIAALKAEVTEKLAEGQRQIERTQAEAEEKIEVSHRANEELVATAMADAERARTLLLEAAEKEVEEANAEAQRRLNRLSKEMFEKEEELKGQVSELNNIVQVERKEKERAVREVYDMSADRNQFKKQLGGIEEKMEKMTQDYQEELGELKKQVDAADAKLTTEQKKYGKLVEDMQGLKAEAKDKERRLNGDIQLLRASSVKLEEEVSSWKETFESQGYCNSTLIREDSKRLLNSAWGSASDKVAGLYDAHLAEVVNESIVPLYNEHISPIYNQHIRPVYVEHVSPIVKTIEGEAAKEAQKARSGAARLVRQSSSSALGVVKEKEFDSILPEWLVLQLDHWSKDGEQAVDVLFKGLLIIVAILCRSLILRIIWAPFSLVWFFCPLRLLVGGRQEEKSAKRKSQRRYTSLTQGILEGSKGLQNGSQNGSLKTS